MANEYSDADFIRELELWVAGFTQREVREALRGITQQYQPRLEAAMLAGNTAEVYLITNAMATKFAEAIEATHRNVYNTAGSRAAGNLRTINVQATFSGSNPRAEEFLRAKSARLVSEITNEQVVTLQRKLHDAMQRGINPRKAARELVGTVGLTERQMRAVANYRRLLEQGSSEALDRALRDTNMDALVRSGKLSPAQIDRMVAAYQRNYLRYRTEMIARTEMLSAANHAVHEAYEQATDAGDLDPEQYVRQWLTATDERVRGTHRSMHRQVRPKGEPFVTGAGYRAMYPHDPSLPARERIHCRCIVATRFRAIVEAESK